VSLLSPRLIKEDQMAPRPPSIRRALDAELRSQPLEPWGQVTAALARRLAAEIDAATDPDLVLKLAARLLPMLETLGMRKVPEIVEGSARGGRTTLDDLRARRARLGDAAVVDPASS
jgi:hypothetical protein